MTEIIYQIVEHDGGWAYKLGDVFSETFATREEAVEAANIVAKEHEQPGETSDIEYQDEEGKWHAETADGRDRPEADVAVNE
jgi:hypothetical protein